MVPSLTELHATTSLCPGADVVPSLDVAAMVGYVQEVAAASPIKYALGVLDRAFTWQYWFSSPRPSSGPLSTATAGGKGAEGPGELSSGESQSGLGVYSMASSSLGSTLTPMQGLGLGPSVAWAGPGLPTVREESAAAEDGGGAGGVEVRQALLEQEEAGGGAGSSKEGCVPLPTAKHTAGVLEPCGEEVEERPGSSQPSVVQQVAEPSHEHEQGGKGTRRVGVGAGAGGSSAEGGVGSCSSGSALPPPIVTRCAQPPCPHDKGGPAAPPPGAEGRPDLDPGSITVGVDPGSEVLLVLAASGSAPGPTQQHEPATGLQQQQQQQQGDPAHSKAQALAVACTVYRACACACVTVCIGSLGASVAAVGSNVPLT